MFILSNYWFVKYVICFLVFKRVGMCLSCLSVYRVYLSVALELSHSWPDFHLLFVRKVTQSRMLAIIQLIRFSVWRKWALFWSQLKKKNLSSCVFLGGKFCGFLRRSHGPPSSTKAGYRGFSWYIHYLTTAYTISTIL